MTTTDYQVAKDTLKDMADYAKEIYYNDKPAIRESINDGMDAICRDLNLSDHKRDLLANYACKLHPR